MVFIFIYLFLIKGLFTLKKKKELFESLVP